MAPPLPGSVAPEIDLLDPATFAAGQPYEQFRWLREHDPVHWHPEPDGPGFWVVTRYDDVKAVGRDAETFSSVPTIAIADTEVFDIAGHQMMLMMDPPRHTRYRRLLNSRFTPKASGGMSDRIAELARRIVDNVIERGECDFVADVAGELPSFVVAELLGLPLDDGRRLYELTEIIHTAPAALAPGAQEAAVGEMFAYASQVAAEKRARPADDLSSVLVQSEVDGCPLDDIDFNLFFLLLVDAGGDTTRNLVADGMLALMAHPDQRARLTAELDGLMPTALEELLRWVSPVIYMRRTARRDTELGGRRIAAGDKVVMYYGSANRDASVFPDPDRFDLARTPNEHVAFGGGGPHFCLGAHLARIEIAALFRELLTRMPDLELAGPVERLPSNFISGPKHMPVRFTPGSRVGY
jgi:cytochrome P450